MTPPLVAGILAGIAALVVFLIVHHIWIWPIWFILPFGLVIAVPGGLAVGWAYGELLRGLPPRPWTSLALVALFAIILLPSIVLAELRAPMFDVSVPGGRLNMSLERTAVMFILELSLTATLAGGLAGWWIGRTVRAALATSLAGLIFALGPGHNIPFLGGTPGSAKGTVLLSAIAIVSSVVLVEAHRALSGGRSQANPQDVATPQTLKSKT